MDWTWKCQPGVREECAVHGARETWSFWLLTPASVVISVCEEEFVCVFVCEGGVWGGRGRAYMCVRVFECVFVCVCVCVCVCVWEREREREREREKRCNDHVHYIIIMHFVTRVCSTLFPPPHPRPTPFLCTYYFCNCEIHCRHCITELHVTIMIVSPKQHKQR